MKEAVGWHRHMTTSGAVARGLILENSLFLKSEIDVEDSRGLRDVYRRALNLAPKIYFDSSIGAFLITPLENRSVNYELRSLYEPEQSKLELARNAILGNEWLSKTDVLAKIRAHDPYAMVVVAKELLKNRRRIIVDGDKGEKYIHLIQLLTGTAVGVFDWKNNITYHIENDYDGAVRLKYTIYWLTHYLDYKWNPSTNRFENTVRVPLNFRDAYKLYLQLHDTNCVSARAAFVRLTEANEDAIKTLNDELDEISQVNSCLPTFPKQSLEQLSKLTRYCRDNHIEYKGGNDLLSSLASLRREDITFAQRYKKENELIATLTPSNITKLEYYAVIYESNWGSTYSMGRILDKFYSKNWHSIVSDEKQLALYLKKATLFSRLQIIGSSSRYLCKFTYADAQTIAALKKLNFRTKDPEIKEAIEKIITKSYWIGLEQKRKPDVTNLAEHDKKGKRTSADFMRTEPVIEKIEDTLLLTFHSTLDTNEKKQQIAKIALQATYSQLPVALKYLSLADGNDFSKRNQLIQEIFGIPAEYIHSKRDLDIFLKNYHAMNEVALYRYYLKIAGIDIWTRNGKLDYTKVYAVLKYDLTPAFVGGNLLDRSTGIFAVAKMLEAEFGTKLGLPDKNEEIGWGTWVFTPYFRTKWMTYLKEHNLVENQDKESPSFVDCDPLF